MYTHIHIYIYDRTIQVKDSFPLPQHRALKREEQQNSSEGAAAAASAITISTSITTTAATTRTNFKTTSNSNWQDNHADHVDNCKDFDGSDRIVIKRNMTATYYIQ